MIAERSPWWDLSGSSFLLISYSKIWQKTGTAGNRKIILRGAELSNRISEMGTLVSNSSKPRHGGYWIGKSRWTREGGRRGRTQERVRDRFVIGRHMWQICSGSIFTHLVAFGGHIYRARCHEVEIRNVGKNFDEKEARWFCLPPSS